ncbi:hypothetical protein ASPZODRAFT_1216561 [Penicilliopsis zonata CBS 506.65]|uniref:Uncharacterized protein n=1 Tax=Penicilliopsis zonata CBS 506.65 TaxID=1073090 RepID=A0A1L9S7G1_9EURO|nr:hypothetical protein ASPZODRAFT_1216561 [Penicilliopsis zonata CBS 506.65]OJJ43097.1 hypothetical protein ASPZODRAFT_1216561 [Penicilliopsis zonata CBS 506.65]
MQLDGRNWRIKNRYCFECHGDCPICGIPCCIFDTARSIIQHAESSTRAVDEASQVLELVDISGNMVRDETTFRFCSSGGGCERHVCTECSGICPEPLCQDIQCKCRSVNPNQAVCATGISSSMHKHKKHVVVICFR